MKRYRRIPVTTLIGVIGLSTLILFGCDVAPVPGRFTYIVKYEVTGTAGTVATVRYKDETDTISAVPIVATSPWSVERPCTYEINNPFDPELVVDVLNVPLLGDTITLRIIVKDYKTNFQEEVIGFFEVENTGAALPTTPFTIYGPQLPK